MCEKTSNRNAPGMFTHVDQNSQIQKDIQTFFFKRQNRQKIIAKTKFIVVYKKGRFFTSLSALKEFSLKTFVRQKFDVKIS